jgi:hypothetical protein
MGKIEQQKLPTRIYDLPIDCIDIIGQNLNNAFDFVKLHKILGQKLRGRRDIVKEFVLDDRWNGSESRSYVVNVDPIVAINFVGVDKIRSISTKLSDPKSYVWSDSFIAQFVLLTNIKIETIFKLSTLATLPNLKILDVKGLVFIDSVQPKQELSLLESLASFYVGNFSANFWQYFPKLTHFKRNRDSGEELIVRATSLTSLDYETSTMTLTACLQNIRHWKSISFPDVDPQTMPVLISCHIGSIMPQIMVRIKYCRNTLTKLVITPKECMYMEPLDFWNSLSALNLKELNLDLTHALNKSSTFSFRVIKHMPLESITLITPYYTLYSDHAELLNLQSLRHLHLDCQNSDCAKICEFIPSLNLQEITLKIALLKDLPTFLPISVVPKITLHLQNGTDTCCKNYLIDFLCRAEMQHPKLNPKIHSAYARPRFHTMEICGKFSLQFLVDEYATIQRFNNYSAKGKLRYFKFGISNIFIVDSNKNQVKSKTADLIVQPIENLPVKNKPCSMCFVLTFFSLLMIIIAVVARYFIGYPFY